MPRLVEHLLYEGIIGVADRRAVQILVVEHPRGSKHQHDLTRGCACAAGPSLAARASDVNGVALGGARPGLVPFNHNP
jgi:hypothetical protein